MSWIRRHGRNILIAVISVIASVSFALTIRFQADASTQRNTDRTAAAAARKAAIEQQRPIICHLVDAYTHPVVGTDQTHRADQVDLAWQQVGKLVGCPQ